MKKLFTFKKLSTKITFIIGLIILIVCGSVAGYMQTRIITEIDRHSRLSLLNRTLGSLEESNIAFSESTHRVAGIKNLIEASFDVGAYKKDSENYFNNNIRAVLSGYVCSIIDQSEFISAAYFAVHPDLSGRPFVCEVYFEEGENGIEEQEPQTYEEYMQKDSEDMEWFYGSHDSGAPYWSPIYEWTDGTIMVSYTVPVIVDNITIGVAGIDMTVDHIKNLVGDIKAYDTGFALLKDGYGEFFETGDAIKGFNDAEREKLVDTALANPGQAFDINLNGIKYMAAAESLMNDYKLYLLAPMKEVNAELTASLIRFTIIFIVAYAITLVIAYRVGKPIGRPVTALSAFMRRAGTTGNIASTPEEKQLLIGYAESGGEIGQLIKDSGVFVDHVIEIADKLEHIADGDLTVDIKALSDSDTMAISMKKMTDSLNAIFGDINTSTHQVATGSKQIADGAASLAGGASEQSAAIDRLSASIHKIQEQTGKNAAVAREAAELSNVIRGNAEKGSAQMDNMMQAVTEINDASGQIGKVIKVIDDIAFQTNILALNAAVEAARAGQHGKGFAVVAEEVRNLAAKSAEAARDTGGLIENSVAKADLGMSIATETAESLKEIVDGINRSTGIIEKIAIESDEQSAAIEQLNEGIGQVSQVVQLNSATAQESAASSKKMSGQSAMLEELIAQFKLKGVDRLTDAAPRLALNAPEE